MNVIIDTCVWSDAFRKSRRSFVPHVEALSRMINEGRAVMLGPIRQEILSGIRDPKNYEKLRESLRAFPDLLIRSYDYELAAGNFNLCRQKGIQGSNTDFLICAVAGSRKMPILTTDKDFAHYQKILGIELLPF